MGFGGEGGEPPRYRSNGGASGPRESDPYRARSIPAIDALPRRPVEAAEKVMTNDEALAAYQKAQGSLRIRRFELEVRAMIDSVPGRHSKEDVKAQPWHHAADSLEEEITRKKEKVYAVAKARLEQMGIPLPEKRKGLKYNHNDPMAVSAANFMMQPA
ncbi:hypothetical protein CO112_01355 [Candidatus Dojkabacteria bacterium CG_4_9_14_3_um_filter_150_Dojkabacteria_WS6_41_13]|uniref:Uncharacterized protein n=1 Tax=Candidatus Dojkabacteria bacterium CG_4_10_14_0_2_um_filter_Dojkabacteria_WS6_41_15 TaxID=2014249 RepID=A0A2M7W309_9BACT|nr:MAG: hypothetical protein COZ14_03710 [Candidatus Dojkabacteria bacterium CG_4_10_14_3_um_filter_Dojkabacteria_WS6_41_9]PJA14416.1 MAG: hypothetical protein COX64_02045 [Candidatus Dojkabacteria bacterium CG_4_10_14_0_2_um_filter_Dojkabacteria_WS6_41_15]PJB23232.1 MAG: hypothetical protein CO112_01355 [Candidatus Dojkabacteria bacterium CG_4_9_14_3_um_filter_150_Dojkabacteria_WS6_41_13]